MEMDVAFPGGMRVDVRYKGFTVWTDQPKENGGEGSAPSPFDLFLASIASCAGYYALNFCMTRGLSTDGMEINMRTEYDDVKRVTGKIILKVKVPEGFPGQYNEALVRSVESCTVKRHIQNPPEFEVIAVK